jgi:tRNA (mo5U34)-methyltransferase
MSTTFAGSMAEHVERLAPWFHNLHLPDGTQTAPDHFLGDFPRVKWLRLQARVPADLDGWTVLDIGCNAGFYSLELARRGARVTAVDHDPHYLRQARWAADLFGLADRIAFEERDVYSLAHDSRKYDLVLFMGVFYHLRYPVLGLDIVARKIGRLLIFQTMTCPGETRLTTPDDLSLDDREQMNQRGWPKMAFIEHRLENDPTNWWAPNDACVRALLRSSGLRILSRPDHEVYFCEPDDAASEPYHSLCETEYIAATGVRSLRAP